MRRGLRTGLAQPDTGNAAAMSRPLYAVVGVLGLVAAVVIAVTGWWLAGRAQETLRRSLAVAAEGVATAADTVTLAGDAIEQIDGGLGALEAGLDTAGSAFAELPPVVEEIAALAAEDIPTGLEGVAGSAAALGEVATGLEEALRPLRILGVEVGPIGDLTASLADVDAGLTEAPDRLRRQAERLRRSAAGLEGVDREIDVLVGQVQGTRLGLTDAVELVSRYEQAAADAERLVADAQDDLARQVLAGRVLALVLAGAIALLQLVPLSLAFSRPHRQLEAPPVDRQASLAA